MEGYERPLRFSQSCWEIIAALFLILRERNPALKNNLDGVKMAFNFLKPLDRTMSLLNGIYGFRLPTIPPRFNINAVALERPSLWTVECISRSPGLK